MNPAENNTTRVCAEVDQQQYQDQQGQWQDNPNYANPALSSINILDAIKICFKKYANFKGRAPRAEFGWWQLFIFMFTFIGSCIPFFSFVFTSATIVPSLAVSWRRLHDINKSGAFYLLYLFPSVCCTILSWIGLWVAAFCLGLIAFIFFIIMIIKFCKAGAPHPNNYGPNPYGINDGQPQM